MTRDELAIRAIAVRALLDDPNVKDAFAQIESDLVDEWKRCFDPAERDNLWRALNIMDRLKTWLVSASSHDIAALRRAK